LKFGEQKFRNPEEEKYKEKITELRFFENSQEYRKSSIGVSQYKDPEHRSL
jgi:hypothetical protein